MDCLEVLGEWILIKRGKEKWGLELGKKKAGKGETGVTSLNFWILGWVLVGKKSREGEIGFRFEFDFGCEEGVCFWREG